jgi:hypothetical protein
MVHLESTEEPYPAVKQMSVLSSWARKCLGYLVILVLVLYTFEISRFPLATNSNQDKRGCPTIITQNVEMAVGQLGHGKGNGSLTVGILQAE